MSLVGKKVLVKADVIEEIDDNDPEVGSYRIMIEGRSFDITVSSIDKVIGTND